MAYRLLADENTSHRLISACRRLVPDFPIVLIAAWEEGAWLGLDDAALLISCAECQLVLMAFDRSTLAWHAGQLLRAGKDHAGLWQNEASGWDWQNRIVYLPKSP